MCVAIVKSSIKSSCCVDNSLLYKFVGGDLTNTDCSGSIDLSSVGFNKCDPIRMSPTIPTMSQKIFENVELFAIVANSQFLLTTDTNAYFNHSKLTFETTDNIDGNINNMDISINYTNIYGENIVTWNNFYSFPFTQQYTNWYIQESWKFFSVANFSTNIVVLPDFNISTSVQIINNAPQKFDYDYVLPTGETITFKFDYDGSVVTLESIEVFSTNLPSRVEMFLDSSVSTPTTYDVYNLEITKYDVIDSVFIANYVGIKPVKIYNHTLEDIKFNVLTATSCLDEELDQSCGC